MTVQSVGIVTTQMNVVAGQAGRSAATESFGSVMNLKQSTDPKQTASKKTNDDNRISKPAAKSEACSPKTSTQDRITKAGEGTDQDLNVNEPEEMDAKDLEEVLETIATLLNQVTEVLTTTLQVPEEDLLTGALNLEMSPADLLNTEEIKSLFLELNGAEPKDLISDADLLAGLEELQNSIEELLEQAGITDETLFDNIRSLFTDDQKLKDPAFEEVLNDYLTAAEATEAEEAPAFKVEIEDLRGQQAFSEETAEETELKPAETSRDEETKQDTGRDAKNSFVQANDFVKSLANEAKTETNTVTENRFMDLYDISGQTVEQIRVKLTSESSHMEIQLTPEHLGKVEINISSKNGAVTAEITAHNEAAKRALEAGLEDLRTALNDTGLKVENVEVALASYGFAERDDSGEQQGGQRQNRRRVNLNAAADSDLAEDMKTASEIMKELNGGNVDYVV